MRSIGYRFSPFRAGRTRSARAAAVALALLAAACGTEPERVSQVVVVSGGTQDGIVSAALPEAVVVEARTASGKPMPGVALTATVTGSGTVTPPTAVTGTDGRATFNWTLGPAEGPQQLTVSAGEGLQDAVVQVTAAPSPCTLAGATAIQLGMTRSATLASTDCVLGNGSHYDIYRLVLPDSRRLQIDQVSTAFDTYLGLFNANGVYITEDDDSGGGTNARITYGAAAGTYYIYATAYDSGATGGYTISVSDAPPLPPECVVENAPPITIGSPVTGQLASTDCRLSGGHYVDFYRLTVASTTNLQIDLASTAFDTYLALLVSFEQAIAVNDDFGPGTDSRITMTVQPGTYYVAATSFEPGSTGQYQVGVTVVQSVSAGVRSSAAAEGGAELRWLQRQPASKTESVKGNFVERWSTVHRSAASR